MRLTIKRRLMYVWDILTYRKKHGHHAQTKALKLFSEGYQAGLVDCCLKNKMGKQEGDV